MRTILLLTITLSSFLSTQAQFYNSSTISLTNNTEVQGKFIIQTNSQTVEARKNKTKYRFSQLKSITINDRQFTKKSR